MDNHIEEIGTGDKRDKGFTLVELLIVIVILGILATVTVFAVRGITDKGTTSACSADKKTMEVAVESYFAQYGGTAILVDADAPLTPVQLPGSTPARFAGIGAEETLLAAGYLREVSPKVAVDAAGIVTAQAGGGCTFT